MSWIVTTILSTLGMYKREWKCQKKLDRVSLSLWVISLFWLSLFLLCVFVCVHVCVCVWLYLCICQSVFFSNRLANAQTKNNLTNKHTLTLTRSTSLPLPLSPPPSLSASLAYLTATTHGLTENSEHLAEKVGEENCLLFLRMLSCWCHPLLSWWVR